MSNRDFAHSNQALPADAKSPSGTEDGFGVLDEAILESSTPKMSPGVKQRAASSIADTRQYLPDDNWNNFSFNQTSTSMECVSNAQDFSRPRPQGYPELTSSQSIPYAQSTPWTLSATSESFSPSGGIDPLVDFSGNTTATFAQHQMQASQTPAMGLQLNTAHPFQPTAAFPTSPQSCKEGWVSASSSDGLDFRNLPVQGRTHSPPFVAGTHLLRRDGIRKKNARFEIPAERNLRTIDQLINQTSDEQELKELKQQKRLLRNRQAALDSRQRKKQHTERLEEEKKHYTAVISELEEGLQELRMQEAEWTRTRDTWVASQQHYQQYIDSLIVEKEELVRRHTIETGELRKKNNLLLEQLQRFEGSVMSSAPSSAGFSTDFSEFDHMTLNTWENFSVANDFTIEAPHADRHMSTTPKNEPFAVHADGEKAVASGFLLMLLLCGAWVASRSSNSTMTPIPAIPEDMRAASASVLDNLYKDSGIQLEGVSPAGQSLSAATHLKSPTHRQRSNINIVDAGAMSHSGIEILHHRLTAPSQHQLKEQVFSLTPDQYNELSTSEYYPQTPFGDSRSTRDVGEALGATRDLREGTVAETYTRSLLRDRVSTQVLKDFARMVAESNLHTPGAWKPE